MRAMILAAGRGLRLEQSDPLPKILLSFGGRTLLARHLEILDHHGVTQVDIVVGHRAQDVRDEVARLGAGPMVTFHRNDRYHMGSIISLWTLGAPLLSGEEVLFMDGDVLYDHRVLAALCDRPEGDYFLMDRKIEEGEDPVRLCFKDGVLVDFHKRPERPHDWWGEWIGFARFAAPTARAVFQAADHHMTAGRHDEIYESAMRDVLLQAAPGAFQEVDVTGLPWVEIDFPEDLRRAQQEVWPRLSSLAALRRRQG
ncbi:MAG: phosphocholine cytidylyltransferase family protein [Pseudomonadota bacterium]